MFHFTYKFFFRSKRVPSAPFKRTPALKGNPQKKGVVYKITTMTPKKPNSAIRHIAKLYLTNTKRVTARLVGSGYLCAKYNKLLIRGGRANDLPGVGYTAIRGTFDLAPLIHKKKRRSIYGTSRPENHTTHVRRCYRSLGT